jgi:DNA-directed RNA polymerase subunit H
LPAKKAKKVAEEVPTFDVSTHILVPKHELVSPVEAATLTETYHATPSQFPYILTSDPVVKQVGAKPGDFVKITRRSETAGESAYYRYVVEG